MILIKKLSYVCKMLNFMVKGFKKFNLIKKNLEKIKKWNVYLRVYFFMIIFY